MADIYCPECKEWFDLDVVLKFQGGRCPLCLLEIDEMETEEDFDDKN
jgi:hypothetical protein